LNLLVVVSQNDLLYILIVLEIRLGDLKSKYKIYVKCIVYTL